jgi:hypothetical protein
MKKLLLTGIAALFLATGAAHAGCHDYYFRCGNKLVNVYGCREWSFSEITGPGKGHELPSHAFRMRYKGAPNGGLYFRGRKCSCLNTLMAQADEWGWEKCEEDE